MRGCSCLKVQYSTSNVGCVVLQVPSYNEAVLAISGDKKATKSPCSQLAEII